MLQTFTFDGGGRLVNMQADYFRYESGNAVGADESIRMRMDGQDLGTYLPGDAITLPRRGVLFEITPVNPACSGTIRLGLGRLDSARLVGTVRVVDESTSKTLAGLQGFMYHRRAANVAKFGMAGVITTTVGLSIKRLSVFQATAGLVQLFTGTAAPTDTPSLNSNGLQNKLLANGYLTGDRVTALCAASSPTGVELPGVVNVGALQVQAGILTPHELSTPIIVAPDTTFVVVGSAINTEVGIYIDGEEYA